MKINTLCIVDYYLPGYKWGGPIKTIKNMSSELSDDLNFYIMTRDRDIGDKKPYEHKYTIQDFIKTDFGDVYYTKPFHFGPIALIKILFKYRIDIIYLNSFFSFWASIWIIWIKIFLPKKIILLAPRGEFSPGALSLKSSKKNLYIKAVKKLNLYSNIFWHASSQLESDDILKIFPESKKNIYIAADSFDIKNIDSNLNCSKKCNQEVKFNSGRLRLVFISRISPKKNLSYLLNVLSFMKTPVTLDIYGPVAKSDFEYWKKCKEEIDSLPSNVEVQYKGELLPEEVTDKFKNYNFFIFPTLGENFGHVIFESIQAGVPVLISDQTPWLEDDSGAVTVLPLNSINAWVNKLDYYNALSEAEYNLMQEACYKYSVEYQSQTLAKKENLKMFLEVNKRKANV